VSALSRAVGERAVASEFQPRLERIPLRAGTEPRLHNGFRVTFELDDCTQLELETKPVGKPDGWPVFVWHGTPGSAIGPRPRGIFLHRAGIKWIGLSRPGYGESMPHEGRIVADCATYLEAAAKAYGIDKCSVLGRSGGGPPTLAGAALLPELVVNAAVFAGIAPDEDALDWYDSMSSANKQAYGMIDTDPDTLLAELEGIAAETARRSEAVLGSIEAGMSPADREYVSSVAMRRIIAESHADGLKHGAQGRFADIIAAKKPWGFNPRHIQVPVLLAQGGDDTFTPEEHFRWLAANIPTAHGTYYPQMGHMETLELVMDYLGELKRQARDILGTD
jgi:pimeloyl-ACP methyl ester carboxylesterase